MYCRSSFFPMLVFVTFISYVFPIVHAVVSEVYQNLEVEEYEPHRLEDTHQECGLRRPSFVDWNHGISEEFANWTDYNWNNYKSSNYSNFMNYLIGEFAPEAPTSTLQCDSLGSCSIGSCQNIAKDLSTADRQMAYYAFEQIANIDHIYKVIYHATLEATNWLSDAHGTLVEGFTYAGTIQDANKMRHRSEQIASSLVTAALLVTSGAIGFANAIPIPMMIQEIQILATLGATLSTTISSSQFKTGLGLASGATGLINNLYIGLNVGTHGFFNDADVPGKVNGLFEKLFSGISHVKLQQVWKEMHRLMDGRNTTHGNITHGTPLPNLLKSGAFIEHETGLRERLTVALEKTFLGVAIDALWSIDRAYILDTDEYNVHCIKDERGPERNRVCLPERPGRVYWIYDINAGKEGDPLHLANAKVRSPAGLRKLVERPEHYHNITKEDIVRASLWAQENKLVDDQYKLIDKIPTMFLINGSLPGGLLAGAFTIPVCRNPRGEAISSVWSRKGRNYPCMCGEFSWAKNGGYSHGIDETEPFIRKTGFFASEDWQNYCSMHMRCTKEVAIAYNFTKVTGAPNQMHTAKHPYRYCKHPNAHEKKHRKYVEHRHGHPEKDI